MYIIRPISDIEVPIAVETLYSAFFEDDLVRYMFPDENFRKEFLPWAHTRWIKLLMRFNSVFVDSEVRGVAVCVPPKLYPHIPIRYQIQAGLLGAIPKLGIKRIWRPARAYLDSQRRTRTEVKSPMWILDILGVRQEYQGKGIGSALVQFLLEKARQDRTPVYVITHKEQNVRFYEKNGFQLIKKELSLPGGPPTFSLIHSLD